MKDKLGGREDWRSDGAETQLIKVDILYMAVQVERLQGVVRDRRANWAQSLATLRAAKAAGARVTKTSIMLGCGEQPAEVVDALQELRDNGALPLLLCQG